MPVSQAHVAVQSERMVANRVRRGGKLRRAKYVGRAVIGRGEGRRADRGQPQRLPENLLSLLAVGGGDQDPDQL